MLVCTVAAWAIVKLATGNDKFALIAAIVTFVYSVYLGSAYAENGKQVMLKKLKEHAIKASITIVAAAGSIWLTGIVSGWIGAESFVAKFLIWTALMVIIAILEMVFLIPKK